MHGFPQAPRRLAAARLAGTLLAGTLLAGTPLAAGGTAQAATESVVYSFKGGNDGDGPRGSLVLAGGALYGTTTLGGAFVGGCDCGTVFNATTAGVETVLHYFTGGNDGSGPLFGLTKVGAAFYGTKPSGNPTDGGTVFSITPARAEAVVARCSRSRRSDATPPRGVPAYRLVSVPP